MSLGRQVHSRCVLYLPLLLQTLTDVDLFAADCHFSHPPSRPTPFAKGSKPKTSSSYTATFNKASAAPSIGAWPTEKAAHVSDRLKRFNLKENEGEAERIIPGAPAEGNKVEGDKVEIEVEEDKAVLKSETTA